MNKQNSNTNQNAEDEVQEFQPDFSLKEKIGKDISIHDVLNGRNIQSAQKVIDSSSDEFVKWVRDDMKNLEELYGKAAAAPDAALEHVVNIQKAAFSIKSQSGTFGFALGSDVAKSLYDFCENNYVVGDTKHILLIRKHIDTLNTIFKREIRSDGGDIGQQVLDGLRRLVVLFDHPDN